VQTNIHEEESVKEFVRSLETYYVGKHKMIFEVIKALKCTVNLL